MWGDNGQKLCVTGSTRPRGCPALAKTIRERLTHLPAWIEPGESTTWYAELQDAVALVRVTKAKKRPSVGRVRMYVELGTGKTLVTRNAARLS